MKDMRKILYVLTLTLAIAMICATFAACNDLDLTRRGSGQGSGKGNDPTGNDIVDTDPSSAWGHDPEYHWEKGKEDEKEQHVWDGGYTFRQATETQSGIMFYTCLICGANKTETIEAVHTHKFEDGWTADESYHWHASTCGHDVVDQKEEHDWSDRGFPGMGGLVFVCEICGKQKMGTVRDEKYTVGFYGYSDGESTLLGSVKVPYGSDAVAPQVPQRAGFDFSCWDKKITNVKQDMDVYAVYLEKTSAMNVFSPAFVNNMDGTVNVSIYVRGTVDFATLQGQIVLPEGVEFVSEVTSQGFGFLNYSEDERTVKFSVISLVEYTAEIKLLEFTVSIDRAGTYTFGLDIEKVSNSDFEDRYYTANDQSYTFEGR